MGIVDSVDTADIVHTIDTLDIVKSVNSVDNVSSVNSVLMYGRAGCDHDLRPLGQPPIVPQSLMF